MDIKVYTKTGDKGSTTLYGGTKVKKCSERVEAYGCVDEANAFIGFAAASLHQPVLVDLLRLCQKKLIVLSSELASDDRGRRLLKERITEDDVVFLEKAIDEISAVLAPNTAFIVPGQTLDSAVLHLARTAVRRAERAVVRVQGATEISASVLVFLNRLSDLLFVMSRAVDEADCLGAEK